MEYEQTNLSLTSEEKQKLEEIADEQERSVTGQIRYWINHFHDQLVAE